MNKVVLTFLGIFLSILSYSQTKHQFDLYRISEGYKMVTCIDYKYYVPHLYIPEKENAHIKQEPNKQNISKRPLVILHSNWNEGCLEVDVDFDPKSIIQFIKEITILDETEIFLNIKP